MFSNALIILLFLEYFYFSCKMSKSLKPEIVLLKRKENIMGEVK